MNYGYSADKPNDPRQKIWKEQRENRGFDDTELWNLDCTIAKFSLPRVKAFRDYAPGIPSCFSSVEEWHQVLDDIIFALEWLANDKDFSTHSDRERIEKGQRYFGEYIGAMWW